MTEWNGLVRDTAHMLKRIGRRIDAMSMDLARDAGAVAREAGLIARDAEAMRDRAVSYYRATPRAAKLAQVLASLLARYRWQQMRAAARGDAAMSEADHRELAGRATAALAELRGGIAKLGQLASCRPDLIGAVWASELAALQDEVPPIDSAQIRARVEAELGRAIDQVFLAFDDAPIAAASLAQVHGAVLLDGSRVVVKVQVPGIEDAIAADIAALNALAGAFSDVPGVDAPTLAAELSRALAIELDYEAEAQALSAFAAEVGARIVVPRAVAHASTARVLTMTRIDGERLVPFLEQAEPAARDRVLGDFVAEFAEQILVRGRVHADPHPGNVLVATDGRLALLDFGCTLTLSASERRSYARLVLAFAAGDASTAAAELSALGFRADDPARLVELAKSITSAMRSSPAEMDWQQAFADQVAAARALGGLVVPRSFVLLGRVLATLAGLLARFRPAIQVHPLIARHLAAAIS